MIGKAVIGLLVSAVAVNAPEQWWVPPGYHACGGNATIACWDGQTETKTKPHPAPPKPPPLEGVADLLRQSARAVDESRWHDDKAKLVTARTDASLAIEKINAVLGVKH